MINPEEENLKFEILRQKLKNLRESLSSRGRQLLEQAERVDKLYGQETVRSRGYRTEAKIIRETNQPKIARIDQALKALGDGNSELAVSILKEHHLS